jgi:hypothetical protein
MVKMEFDKWLNETFSLKTADLSGVQLKKFTAIYDAEMESSRATEDDEEETPEGDAMAHSKAKASGTYVKASRGETRMAAGGDGASTDGSIEERAAAAAVKASRAEAARVAQIRRLANGADDLAERAINEGMDADTFELNQLRAGRASRSGETVDNSGDSLTPQVYEAALLLHTSMAANRVAKFFSDDVMNRAMSKEMRGFSLVECADRIIRKAGEGYRGSRNQESHMTATRSAGNKLRAAGYSSFSLSSILENAADKVLLSMYQEVVTMWKTFCAVRPLNDFKVHSTYALDPTNTFQKVGPTGDFDQLKFSDRKYSLQAESYGLRLKIDYQTWRNDDLASITNRIGAVGQLGAATIEQIVFFLLMSGINNTAMFHTSNANYLANSANYAMSLLGLTNAEAAIMNQVRPNGTPLGVEFTTLLVTPQLKPVAGSLYTSSKVNETTATGSGQGKATDNPFVNKYIPNPSPYLSNALLKSNDGSTIPHQDPGLWMLFGTSGNAAAINVGFLDGQQTPAVSAMDNQTEMIGFELATSMHFGVGYGDTKLALCCNPNNA